MRGTGDMTIHDAGRFTTPQLAKPNCIALWSRVPESGRDQVIRFQFQDERTHAGSIIKLTTLSTSTRLPPARSPQQSDSNPFYSTNHASAVSLELGPTTDLMLEAWFQTSLLLRGELSIYCNSIS